MRTVPVPFTIRLLDAPPDAAPLVCEKPLRYLPGKRLVCVGTWGVMQVVAKLYVQQGHSRRHWLRQEQGLWALVSRSVPVPVPSYSGRFQTETLHPAENGYCIVSAFIKDSATLEQAWEAAKTVRDRKDLLRAALRCIAALHQHGILQKDLHLRNFLIHGSSIVMVDHDHLLVSKGPLGEKASLKNAGLFFAQLLPFYDDWAGELIIDYAQARGWQRGEVPVEFIYKAIKKSRDIRLRTFLRKIFRESTVYESIRTWDTRAVFRRHSGFPNDPRFVRNPETAVTTGERGNIKRGNASTVTVTAVGGVNIVIKRYNIKNFFYGMSRALRKTRAARSWANAHRLAVLGIETATPLAFVEKRFGPVRKESFYITAYVEGVNCAEFYRDQSISWGEKERVAQKITNLFGALASQKVSHGDLKASNILIAGDRLVLLDLDAMRQHRSERRFRKAFQRDVARFLKNWDDQPEVRGLFKNLSDGTVPAL